MTKERLQKCSNGAFVLAIITAVYAFVQVFLSRRGLPPGVCPIDENRLPMFIAIAFALTSLVLSFLSDKSNSGEKPVEEDAGAGDE